MTAAFLTAMMALMLLMFWRLERKVGNVEMALRTQATGGLHGGVVGRSVIRTVEGLEADTVYLWQLRHRGMGSRRKLVRAGEMSHWRWNMASALLTHLNLDTDKVGVDEGVRIIHDYIAEQGKLAACATYVPPWQG